MKTTVRKDVYQVVTDSIVEAMETRQVIPWQKTWSSNTIAPMNYYSKHIYRGINALMCGISPYNVPFFLTLKQVNILGGKVSKGAKSIPIVFWKAYYKDKDGNTIREKEAKQTGYASKALFPKYYRVFNIEDVENVTFDLPEVEIRSEGQVISKAEKLIGSFPHPPIIDHQQTFSPSYQPITDLIKMPQAIQFDSSEEYYVTIFHELIHATGHEKRLKRKGIMETSFFGSLTYSEEELIAEIGASFLASLSGIESSVFNNSVAYLQGWVQAFQNDKKMIIRAASQAKKAVEYITG